jgi:hypothetical protein
VIFSIKVKCEFIFHARHQYYPVDQALPEAVIIFVQFEQGREYSITKPMPEKMEYGFGGRIRKKKIVQGDKP